MKTLKNTIYIIFAITTLMLSACAKDSNNSTPPQGQMPTVEKSETITGTWVLTYPVKDNITTTVYLQYRADGTFKMSQVTTYPPTASYGRLFEGTYIFDGINLKMKYNATACTGIMENSLIVKSASLEEGYMLIANDMNSDSTKYISTGPYASDISLPPNTLPDSSCNKVK